MVKSKVERKRSAKGTTTSQNAIQESEKTPADDVNTARNTTAAEIKANIKPELSPLKMPPPPSLNASSYEEYRQHAIPTPELLLLRRASLHVPLSCATVSSSSEGNLLTAAGAAAAAQINKRRATLSMRDLLDVMPVDAEFLCANGAGLADNKNRRGSACHIPSKLTE